MAFNSNLIKVEGVVEESLPGLLFRVKITPATKTSSEEGGEDGGREVLAHLAGKLKVNRIRVIPGDRVIIEMANANERRGRIVRRL